MVGELAGRVIPFQFLPWEAQGHRAKGEGGRHGGGVHEVAPRRVDVALLGGLDPLPVVVGPAELTVFALPEGGFLCDSVLVQCVAHRNGARGSGMRAPHGRHLAAHDHAAVPAHIETGIGPGGRLGTLAAVVPGHLDALGADLGGGELEGDHGPLGIGHPGGSGSLSLDGGGQGQATGPEGGVHVVAGHVAHGASPEVPPAAPGEGKESLAEGAFRHGADPGVPVEALGNGSLRGILRHTLGPDGTVGPGVQFEHFAKGAVVHHLFPELKTGTGVALVAHLGHDLVLLRGFKKSHAFTVGSGEWFLDVDVLAEFHGRKSGNGVDMVRGGDHHRVDLVLVLGEHLAVVGVAGDVLVFVEVCTGPALIHVAHGNERSSTGNRVVEVAASLAPTTNLGEAQGFALVVIAVDEFGGTKRRGGSGGGSQEGAAGGLSRVL